MPETAVLTGDLVKSTSARAGALDHSMAIIEAAAGDIAGWTPGVAAGFLRYRGDGWQMATTDPAGALRAALYILARLRADPGALGSRIFIGIAPAPPFRPDDLSSATGEAFILSGRGLDRMSRQRILNIDGPGIGPLHRIVLELLEEHVLKWTREQAEAAVLALPPDNATLAEMGRRLGITPQAVNYRLNGGALQAIRHALRQWEEGMTGPPATEGAGQ